MLIFLNFTFNEEIILNNSFFGDRVCLIIEINSNIRSANSVFKTQMQT